MLNYRGEALPGAGPPRVEHTLLIIRGRLPPFDTKDGEIVVASRPLQLYD